MRSVSRFPRLLLLVATFLLGAASLAWANVPAPQVPSVVVLPPAPGVITAPDYTDDYVAYPSNDPLTNVYVTPDGYPVVRGVDGLWTYPINQSALYHTVGWPPQVWVGAPATVLPVVVP